MKFGFLDFDPEKENKQNDIDNIDFEDLNEFAQKYVRIIFKKLKSKYLIEFKHKFVEKHKKYGENIEIISITVYKKRFKYLKGKTIGTYKLYLKDVGTKKFKVEGSEYLGNETELINQLNLELNNTGFTTIVSIISY